MTSWRFSDSRWSDRLTAPVEWKTRLGLLGVLVVLVVVAAAVTIALGDSAREIAEDARIMTSSAEVSSAAAVLSGEVGQGLLVGQAAPLGSATAATESATRIRQALADLERRVDVLADVIEDESVLAATDDVGRQTLAVADALDRADGEEALLIAENHLRAALTELASRIGAVSEESAGHIAAVDSGLGTVSTAARFVAALLFPALAVLVLYRLLRGSQKMSLLRSELEREREHRHKMDSFVTAASRYIGTPLSAVTTHAQLLRRGSSDLNSGAREMIVDLMAMELEETAEVLADLSTAARYDLGDFDLDDTRIDLRDVIERATSDWGEKQQMTLTIKGNASVSGDEQWISHALRNLVRNAECSGGERVQIEIRPKGRDAVVEVSDDGAALPGDVNDRISEIYYSQWEDDGLAAWRGLALAVARRIAKVIGGDLWYRREERENVFYMTLPAALSHVMPRAAHARVVDPAQGMPTLESIEIVIADGGPDVIYQPIVEISADRHHRVVGYEALAHFESHRPADWFLAASSLGVGSDLELAFLAAAVNQFAPELEGVFLAVKISDSTLSDPRVVQVIENAGASRIVLELSLTDPIPSYEATGSSIEALRRGGTRLAVADFAFADLDPQQMTHLGAELIKIDMSLVRSLPESVHAEALVAGITAMAEVLGISVVAEGVETDREHSMLVGLGVGFGQGQLYGSSEASVVSASERAYKAS